MVIAFIILILNKRDCVTIQAAEEKTHDGDIFNPLSDVGLIIIVLVLKLIHVVKEAPISILRE